MADTEMLDAFLCDAVRTPFGRYGGALARVRSDDLAAHPIRSLLARHPSLDPHQIDDVILGCTNQAGEDSRNVARNAALLAGLPPTVPGSTVNRLCGSGMEAVVQAARAVRQGDADLIIAGGIESMSRSPFVLAKAAEPFQRQAEIHDSTLGWRFPNPVIAARYGLESMAETAENVAAACGIDRADQDRFALASQRKASEAQTSGRLAQEIVPIDVPGRRGETVPVDDDEQPRAETTLERLSALPAPFRDGGTVTAGNASGINDGAVAMLVASDAAIRRHGLEPRARIAGSAVAGVEPRLMGLGPVPATQKLLRRHDLTAHALDLIEVNEAFAAQVLAVLRGLGVADDDPRVNPNGGAIALGHPLGASGARLLQTAALELHRTGKRLALCTLCIGIGQGIATLLERA